MNLLFWKGRTERALCYMILSRDRCGRRLQCRSEYHLLSKLHFSGMNKNKEILCRDIRWDEQKIASCIGVCSKWKRPNIWFIKLTYKPTTRMVCYRTWTIRWLISWWFSLCLPHFASCNNKKEELEKVEMRFTSLCHSCRLLISWKIGKRSQSVPMDNPSLYNRSKEYYDLFPRRLTRLFTYIPFSS